MRKSGFVAILFMGVLTSLTAMATTDLLGSRFSRFHAPGSGGSWCQDGYRSDSYGRGLQAGFTASELRPSMVDEGCYQLGVAKARELKKGTVGYSSECERHFNEGYERGFDVDSHSAGSECFGAGYSAGRAALGTGARELQKGTVGVACVREYERGLSDSQGRSVSQPLTDSRLGACYHTGYFDAHTIPRL